MSCTRDLSIQEFRFFYASSKRVVSSSLGKYMPNFKIRILRV